MPKPTLRSHGRGVKWYWAVAALIAFAILGSLYINAREKSETQTPAINPGQSSKPIKVIAVGDIACSPKDEYFGGGNGRGGLCQHKAVAEAIKREQPDALLLLGDIQYSDGTFEEFKHSFVPAFREVKTSIYAIPGNHEYQSGSRSGYQRAFSTYFPSATYEKNGVSYYAADIGSWKLVALDTMCEYVGGCGPGSAQLDWLKNQLASSPSKCTVAMWHHPVFTSGSHREEASVSRGRHFLSVLYDHKVELVLNGHEHNYERFAKLRPDASRDERGVRSLIVGTGGQRLYPIHRQSLHPGHAFGDDKTHGYLRLTLKQDGYDWQYVTTEGRTLDQGGDACI